jgi:hypothetical protein
LCEVRCRDDGCADSSLPISALLDGFTDGIRDLAVDLVKERAYGLHLVRSCHRRPSLNSAEPFRKIAFRIIPNGQCFELPQCVFE